ncbi:MAG: hypothetical protein LGR52_05725 [Candidatus Thiosymbion ectosymbiont of Robbea hypermnestra]|nr:hypothetical protein [Candidatus Thiosymbion ectosymbiont of Robbea hypermnestra]
MPTTQRPNNDSTAPRGKDLRIPNTTPERLAKTLLRGGAEPRPETKRRKASSL